MTAVLEPAEIRAQIRGHLVELDRLWKLAEGTRPAPRKLTDEEWRVCRLAAATPLTVPEIAARLGLTLDAAKRRLRTAYVALGIGRRHELIAALSAVGDGTEG